MRFSGLVCLLLLFAGLAAAQPQMGDLIVNDKKPLGHIVYIDRSTSQMTTIRPGPYPSIRASLGLVMAENNTDMFLCEEGGPSFSLWRITPKGVLSTYAAASVVNQGVPTACELLQDGKIAITATVWKQRDYLRILDPATKTLTSLYTFNPSSRYFYDVQLNPDNNRLLVCGTTGNELFEYDFVTATMSTLATGLGGVNSIEVDPATGNIVCASKGKLLVISPKGTVQKTISVGSATIIRRVKIDPATGVYFAIAGTSTGAVNRVVEVDGKTGSVIKAHGAYTGFNFTGVDIYGSRQVRGHGPATPGSKYNVDFCFPGLPGHAYVGALAFAQRPGFTLGGSRMNLSVDALLMVSLQGLFVTGFQGTLNTAGRAFGSIALPAFLPKGLTIYCSAVATNGASFVTGNTIGITIR